MALGTSLARTIKERIRDKIDALESVAKVYTFDKFPLEQFPTVIVKYGSMEGEYWSTSENRRNYSYDITVLFQIGSDVNNVDSDRLQYAEEAIGQVVEEIINALDSDYELGQFNADVTHLSALDVTYTEFEYEGGYAKGANITVIANTFYDL